MNGGAGGRQKSIWLRVVIALVGGMVFIVACHPETSPPSHEPSALPPTATPAPTTTSTPTPPPSTPTPLPDGFTGPVTSNAGWTPHIETIAGRQMALVPSGCDVHGHCFDPFWIDVYEVTNTQFAIYLNEMMDQVEGTEHWLNDEVYYTRIDEDGGVWTVDPNYPTHPVAKVDWETASAYCAWRGGMLPDEWAWEYASSGPDGWVYPWGDDFISVNVVWGRYNCGTTCPVGSRPGGVSWVGAHDLAGGIWEFMENDFGAHWKVVRGGSWLETGPEFFVSAERGSWSPITPHDYLGFRCTLPWEPPSE